MNLEEWMYYDACRHLNFDNDTTTFHSIEIWAYKNGLPDLREEALRPGELSHWISQTQDFRDGRRNTATPEVGQLRLLYQKWDDSNALSRSDRMPMSKSTLDLLLTSLELPRCFPFDFETRKPIPIKVRVPCGTSNGRLGIICQSPMILDSFMSMVLSYDPRTNTTRGFLGFQNDPPASGFGRILLHRLRTVGSTCGNPLLLPALSYSLWIDALSEEHSKVAVALRREVQDRTGLMDEYLSDESLANDPMNYDAVHQTLLVQHAYLTNGIADYVSDMGAALNTALTKLRDYAGPILGSQYDDTDVSQFIEDMHVRAKTQMEHRARMLERINMYLQVLYNLMQQQIARDTKRDTSAMKSLSLLTMVFLPATAIASVMAPFVITDQNGGDWRMSSRFWVLWVVAAPVTLIVIVMWLIWIQRIEVMNTIRRWKNSKQSRTSYVRSSKKASRLSSSQAVV